MNTVELNKEVMKIAASVLPGFTVSLSDDPYATVLVVKDPEGVMPMKKFVELTKRVQYVLRTNGYNVNNKEMFYEGERASMYWNK